MKSAQKRSKRKVYHLSAFGDFQISYDVERLLRMLNQMERLGLYSDLASQGMEPIAQYEYGNLAHALLEEGSLDVQVKLEPNS